MASAIRPSCFVLAFVLSAAPAIAQTGSLSGRVTERGAGNGIAGARVQAIAPPNRIAAVVISQGDGAYRFINLDPGTYAVAVTRLGFEPVRVDSVTVTAGSTTTANIVMTEFASRLDPVVSTVSKTTEKASEAPASVSVINQQEINERPSLSTTDHVRGIPGVDVAAGGLLQANVVARGFNNIFSGSLLTLTDNRFAFVPSLRVNVPYLSPTTNEDIERIEVVLGPGAALYGPNSANGVMHVITRSPFQSKGTTLTVDGGERSLFRGGIRHAGAPTERFGYKFSFDYFQAEDWESVDPVEQSIGVQRSFDLKKYSGEARVDFRPTPNSEIIGTYGRSQAGSAIEPTGLGAAQVDDWVFNTYQLRARTGRLFGQIFLNSSDAGNTFLLRNANRPDGGRIVDKSKQWVTQLQHGISLGTRQEFIYGLDYIRTLPETEGTINGRNEDDDDITEVGGYLHSVTRLTDQFQFVGAVRLDDHSRLADPIVSPRAALVFTPSEGQSFRVTYNRAFSTPSTNNQFLDLQAGAIPIPGTPGYVVRTLGTPQTGFQFKRDCTGGLNNLCMRSPFTPPVLGGPSTFLPAFAPAFYQAAVAAVVAGGLQAKLQAGFEAQGFPTAQAQAAAAGIVGQLQGTPADEAATVGTQLRVLNPTTGTFGDVSPNDVRDLEAIKSSITNAYEIGYKGVIGQRLLIGIDLWQQKRDNFVGPLIVETPNVFLDRATLTTLLTTRFTPVVGAAAAPIVAGQVAAAMAGVSGGTSAAGTTGVPLGVVNLNNPLNNATDIVLAYRNFGEVTIKGADLATEFLVNDLWSVAGTYSYVNKDFFSRQSVGGVSDIALNAPKNKGSLALRLRDATRGFSAELRGRHVSAFPMNSGVYIGDVPTYNLLDAQLSLRPTFLPNAMWSISGTNILNNEHIEYAGGGVIGRMIMTRLQYTF